ncbi:MAG: hypothetical protein R8G33_01515 [Gammaproteobacteria bacterium]|nr:hypothetical protein [Gammaproteobacteria bacterium]
MNDALYQHVFSNLQYQQDAVLDKFVEELKSKFQDSLLSIVFYGSCMRTHEYDNAMLDFYVIVEDYSQAYSNRWYSIANTLLAPNVFYQQVQIDGRIYRAKYAVVSKSALSSGVKSFHPYFWARFTQPLALIYVDHEQVKKWLVEVQCIAASTFIHSIINVVEGEISSEKLWVKGLQLTYGAELRAEKMQRASLIYHSQRAFYDGLTFNIFPKNQLDSLVGKAKLFASLKWKLRKILGKFLSILRLMKATTTFVNGVDYIAWKIERHTGEEVIVSERLRKYPLLYGWPLLFKLYKQGKIR